jgi:hypothetical protein
MRPLLRIQHVVPLEGFRLRLTLTDGSIVERDVSDLLTGPIFDPIRREPARFREARVEEGSVVWPNDADLCPDVLIWGGPPPREPHTPPKELHLEARATGA